MTVSEVRQKYLDFFKARGHIIVPSSSLVPENDPTTLFTGSGMQPMVPYLLGKAHPAGVRLSDSQKCFRAMDIEEVGDNRHTTFFEMLGNWSFGDYFKQEQLGWFFEFLTDEIGLDPHKLYVTVFAGDECANLARDTEAADIWKELFSGKGIEAKDVHVGSEADGGKNGMQGGRIFYYEAKKNWWSRAGVPENMPSGEPGGADSEVFYDFGLPHDTAFGAECHPNCDCGRFMEIGNSVFMEYVKEADGSFGKLPRRNVDFGGGLERIAAASNADSDVFMIDAFQNLIADLEKRSDKNYADNKRSFRIIADHVRAATFLMSDGVYPSNTDQGYFVRRLLRRAILQSDKLGIADNALEQPIKSIISTYQESYPNVRSEEPKIIEEAKREEERFRKTLQLGLKEFEKLTTGKEISGTDAFILFSTYGFPIELTQELAAEKNIAIDLDGFKQKMHKHQELSRAGSEQKFKGGMADHGEMSVKYHTGTHLLHQALRQVLGNSVFQKGSNITPERLRFDFSFDRKMTDEEKREVENIINTQIAAALPVTFQDLPLEEAEKLGAIGLFEEKYGDRVRVYSIGEGKSRFSMEFCGGPHVENTSELGTGGKVFRIEKEEATSAGVRRIRAVLA